MLDLTIALCDRLDILELVHCTLVATYFQRQTVITSVGYCEIQETGLDGLLADSTGLFLCSIFDLPD